MSATSDSGAAATIALPKGGGAIQGLGETFAPDLFTGTGNFTVPLAIPVGRNGFQPQLNLIYSTGNGNGPFGLGWSLSVPGVARKTAKGVPRYDDDDDTFVLSGSEDLVAVERDGGRTRYRPRTEGLFSRITHRQDGRSDLWEVRSRDGLVSVYGSERQAEAPPDWQDPAVITDPDDGDRSKVFAWKLSRTEDPFGNRIEYAWRRDRQDDGARADDMLDPERHWDQLYLAEIRYVDYESDGETRYLVRIAFSYEDRPDPFSDYRAGFEIRTRLRCTRIDVFTDADRERHVRTYRLVYLDRAQDAAGRLPANGVSLLDRVEIIGRDGEATEELPPVSFGYTRFEPSQRDFFPLTGRGLPVQALSDPNLALVDLFGNGLPDIVELNGAVRYWRNRGDGRFDLPRQMDTAPGGRSLAEHDVQLIDADGNGRADLMLTTPEIAGYFPLSFDGSWDVRSFQRYRSAPSFSLEDPELRLVDLDGDGVTDAVRSGSRLECFFNDAEKGWSGAVARPRRAAEAFPDVSFADPRVKWADMSGDGLQDIVLVHDGNVEYWPNLGHGNWARRISMRDGPRLPHGYDPRLILLGDVDGDGLADLIYVDHCKVLMWINKGGNGWSERIEIDGTPAVTGDTSVRLVDLMGTGVPGLLWSAPRGAPGRHQLHFLDFTGGQKPYLLERMDNNMGAVTRVGYAPSTRFYLDDEARPETRWQTPLPFPVQVVARVAIIDVVSGGKLTTEYAYHHGYWDGVEREFRGFGRVDRRDTEVFERYHAPSLHDDTPFGAIAQEMFSPPVETRTWFHQGPVDDRDGDWAESDFAGEYWAGDPDALSRPEEMREMLRALPRAGRRDALRALRGSVLRTEFYALDGSEREDRPYTVTENLYGVREEAPPAPDDAARKRVFFPHPLGQRVSQWERGDDPMTRLSFTDGRDAYGQPGIGIAIAVPRGRDYRRPRPADEEGEPYLATLTMTAYASRDDDERYIVDRAARSTAYEILNDGSPSAGQLRQAVLEGTARRSVIGQSLNYYDGEAFEGLGFGEIGDYGALVRSESLVLTEEILERAFAGEADGAPATIPPYLTTDGDPEWTDEYPEEFRQSLPPRAGYEFYAEDEEHERGFFSMGTRRRYDFHDDDAGQGRGLLKESLDPLGNGTTIDYDAPYALLTTQIADAAGLDTRADHDYRVLKPQLVTDANGNRTVFKFTPIGLLASTAVMGKQGEALGDTSNIPGTTFAYSFSAFLESGDPVHVRTVQRVQHANNNDAPADERDLTIESTEYSDGFGRLIQTRALAEDVLFGDPQFGDSILPIDQGDEAGSAAAIPGRERAADEPPNVVVSGWQVTNNKGRVVEKYEPYFAAGWDYAPPTGQQFGQKASLYYDPEGRVSRTVHTDGTEQWVVRGVPQNLENPGRYRPTPWASTIYDCNDNGRRTHPDRSRTYRHHWNTPSSSVVDALGRTIETVARNGPEPRTDWYTTRSEYDIRGNVWSARDALDREAFRYVHDLADNPLRMVSIDAGVRRTVLDAAGNVIEQRDSKGALLLRRLDRLLRPSRLWARDTAGEFMKLRERWEYGDAGDPAQQEVDRETNRAANRLGRLWRRYDEAGRASIETYDFKGNVQEKVREVVADTAILAVFDQLPSDGSAPNFHVDWQPTDAVSLDDLAAAVLEHGEFRTSLRYDALNRMIAARGPRDVDGARKVLATRYNRAGVLEAVAFDGDTYVEWIAYNARGQRTLVAYGNGTLTRLAHDPQTFRLARLRSERADRFERFGYRPSQAVLQDTAYTYDLMGNITQLSERAPGTGIRDGPHGADALERRFAYDPLYQLTRANGREWTRDPPAHPWSERPEPRDLNATSEYTQQYHYDRVGNLTQLSHTAAAGSFRRLFAVAPGRNHLTKMSVGQRSFAYSYDPNGNAVAETTSRRFEWDHSDRMRAFRTVDSNDNATIHAFYLYDPDGTRVKKLVRTGPAQYRATTYVDDMFEHWREVRAGRTIEQNIFHIVDNQTRIATRRVGDALRGDRQPAIQYHLGDHLGSCDLVTDEVGNPINREEYTPFGETSFGSFAAKRYRFSAKERDRESSLCYFGARYYSPWLARWISPDPLGTVDGLNLYSFVNGNPTNRIDPAGTQQREWQDAPAADRTYHRPGGHEIDMGGNYNAGEGRPTYTQHGAFREAESFWKAFENVAPWAISEENALRISGYGSGPNQTGFRAPEVDELWIRWFPDHAPYAGDKLIHHHVDKGEFAVAMPKTMHEKFSKTLHQDWIYTAKKRPSENPLVRRRRGGGAVGALAGMGILFLVSEGRASTLDYATAADPTGLVDAARAYDEGGMKAAGKSLLMTASQVVMVYLFPPSGAAMLAQVVLSVAAQKAHQQFEKDVAPIYEAARKASLENARNPISFSEFQANRRRLQLETMDALRRTIR